MNVYLFATNRELVHIGNLRASPFTIGLTEVVKKGSANIKISSRFFDAF
jgi:hypothetical protein